MDIKILVIGFMLVTICVYPLRTMEIRNSKFMNDDGTFQSEFFDMVHDYEKRFEYASNNTSLPENPDFEKIQELVMDVNRRSL